MQNGFNVCLDFERIKNSSSVISDIKEQIESRNLLDVLTEIEEQIKDINFCHGNCIEKYKNEITQLSEEITRLKQELSQLDTSLKTAYQTFSTNEKYDNNELINIAKLFPNTSTSNSIANLIEKNPITRITTQANLFKSYMDPTIQQSNTKVNETNASIISLSNNLKSVVETAEINTVPIGLGIAASGITGAIGAVVVDSLNDSKKETIHEVEEPTPDEYYQEPQKEEPMDYQVPYHANRNQEKIDLFLNGNEEREEDIEND